MRQTAAIAGREVRAFFHSAMAPVVLTSYLVVVGLFFTIFLFGYSDISLAALQSPRSGNYVNLAEGLFRPLVSNSVFFLLFLMPALAMRLFSPEFRSGRYDLMASWPVSDGTWVVGKWLSSLMTAGLMILTGAAYIGVVWFLGDPEPGPALSAVLGQVLFASMLLAWGLLASALFSHQMVAYFLAFIWSMFLFIIGSLGRFMPGFLARIVVELSSLTHFEKFSRGVIDSRDLLYFIILTAIPLVAAASVLAARRLPARRRLVHWVPTLLAVVLGILIYVLGQFFVFTWDLTGNKRYSLAPQSLQVLDNLEDNLAVQRESGGVIARHVQAYAFYQRLDPARDITEALLKSCAQRTRSFRFEVVDPESDLELVRRYGVTTTRTIVVEVGDRHTSVLQPEESALISAVYRLAAGKRTRVCQLTGHGEHRITGDDRSGYSTYDQTLLDQGYDVVNISLDGLTRIPNGCDVLVIAGPRLEPESRELGVLSEYIERGGSVLAMFDPGTPEPWRDWMATYRVGLTDHVLVDVQRVGDQQGVGARTILVDNGYGDHEIVRSLQGVTTLFPLVQPLELVGEPDSSITGAILIKSSEMTWGETDPYTRFSGKPSYDPETDPKGPLPFGLVMEIASGPEDSPPGRLVVLGNSEFLNNATVNLGGNRDFLLNAIGWLASEEDLIQLRGRDPLSQPVVLSEESRLVLGWGSVLGWPLLVGSLSLGFMLYRRRSGGSG